jgi:hypothetical protein
MPDEKAKPDQRRSLRWVLAKNPLAAGKRRFSSKDIIGRLRLAPEKGEPHERHLDIYRNFGGMGDSSGLCAAPDGHFHLNAGRLSGDRQTQRENPAAPR